MVMKKSLNILFLAAEATPFIKVGGLADVAGSLPRALRNLPPSEINGLGLDVRLTIPFYGIIQSSNFTLEPLLNFMIPIQGGETAVSAYQCINNGVPVYFIGSEIISKSENVYSSNGEQDREKFILFTIAALELARLLGWKVDVIHANDWHTALALYLIKTRQTNKFYNNTSGILTVHNLPYMGGDGQIIFHKYEIHGLNDIALPTWARNQMLPMGLWAADAIVAVSKTYADEIKTPEYGCGLHGFLKCISSKITGIVNGLDLKQWDPFLDPKLFKKFNAENLENRKKNKIFLLESLTLMKDITIPLICMVTRINYQKGVDTSIRALHLLLELPWNFVLLGSGDPYIEAELNQFQAEYPDRVRILLKYDDEMSRQIYAGADILLMPSRYEPCGLSQMIAMRYGCVPVVHNTGGLKDTVTNNETGFVFEGSEPELQAAAIRKALTVYAMQREWEQIQRNGMVKDFSWSRSALGYDAIYRSLVADKSSGGNT